MHGDSVQRLAWRNVRQRIERGKKVKSNRNADPAGGEQMKNVLEIAGRSRQTIVIDDAVPSKVHTGIRIFDRHHQSK